ncbi:FAD-binding oxidoreductase [Roseomonas alkaliterrae]|uniref:D-amino-acid dehydrogenase n=1 Tax=Neoroseomonas alkaliterrae TaxID=1452450 RepID=A0A840Y5B0_9PROT|nr:FAD-binding oxidoreductase [Neoroseomonas alkaliterrae]MBB5689812.1 D-amino-acid dehydrogenase [Neoroseomonas alkaliterrae]MBR0675612.1 FAD-binding oxidoreductase [Neoroseomonas alkaliterrae]
MTRHVVVIGAGIVGACSAVEALREGFRVTILDPADPGGEQAASYGNGCWLSPMSVIPPAVPGLWRKVPKFLMDPLGPLAIRWSYLPRVAPWLMRYLRSGWTWERVAETARALRPLVVDAPALHKALAEEAGVGHLIERRGLIYIYPSRADFEAEAKAWEIRHAVGVRWLELGAEELRQREPDLDRRYGFGVMVEEGGHCTDPGAYTAALVAHAVAQGARLVRARATGFAIEGGRLAAVRTDAGEVAADAAVIAAGAFAKPLAAAAGDRVPLETERGYHAEVAAPEVAPRHGLMPSDGKMSIMRTARGLRCAGQVEIAGLDAAPNWKRAEILRDHLLRCFPGLPRDLPAERVKVWLGHRPSMPDGKPCLGRSRASADILHAFGHGHTGLVAGARTGRVVAALLAGREPEIPIAPFDPARFA